MSIKKKIVATVVSGLAIAGFVAATALAFPQLTSAQTATPTAPTTGTAQTGRGDRTAPAARGAQNAPSGDVKGGDTYLADALGITVADLQAAQTKANEAAIKQAVADGLITQAQADAMLNKTDGQAGCALT